MLVDGGLEVLRGAWGLGAPRLPPPILSASRNPCAGPSAPDRVSAEPLPGAKPSAVPSERPTSRASARGGGPCGAAGASPKPRAIREPRIARRRSYLARRTSGYRCCFRRDAASSPALPPTQAGLRQAFAVGTSPPKSQPCSIAHFFPT